MSVRRGAADALRAACGAVAALCALPCEAGEVPDPLFWPSGADLLRQVDDGEFRARLELHLLQYAARLALFTFQPRMAFELLLSHSISGGAFGGGSAKAIVAF